MAGGVGAVVAGLVPEKEDLALHDLAATVMFVAQGAGVLLLAYAVRHGG